MVRVLFVDDEPAVLEGLRRLLRRHRDLEIATASSAEEGLALLACTPIDVVVSDFAMPGATGGTFLLAVRERYPHCRRVLLSGVPPQDASHYAEHILKKPCDEQQLLAILRLPLA